MPKPLGTAQLKGEPAARRQAAAIRGAAQRRLGGAAAAAAARSAAESGGPLSAAHGIALMNRFLGPTGWSHSVLSVRQCGLQEAGGSFEAQHVARVRVCVHSGDGPRRAKARTRFVSS